MTDRASAEGLRAAAQDLVRELDRIKGTGDAAADRAYIVLGAALRDHSDSGDIDAMKMKDAVMRLPTHDHIFNDTPYLERLDVLDLIDTLSRAARASTPAYVPMNEPEDWQKHTHNGRWCEPCVNHGANLTIVHAAAEWRTESPDD